MTPIQTGADLQRWLDAVAEQLGRPLSRERAAALLVVTRSAIYAALNVGRDGVPHDSTRLSIPTAMRSHIEALEELRQAAPAAFASLAARRLALTQPQHKDRHKADPSLA